MKTKTDKMIEFLKEAKKDLFREGAILKQSRIYEDIPKVITLLQKGKKYEVMWKSIVNASKCLNDPKGRKVLKMVIKDIKQGMKESEKYFKEAKNEN